MMPTWHELGVRTIAIGGTCLNTEPIFVENKKRVKRAPLRLARVAAAMPLLLCRGAKLGNQDAGDYFPEKATSPASASTSAASRLLRAI